MPRGSHRSGRSLRQSSLGRTTSSYGLVAAALGIGLWLGLSHVINWKPYLVWLVAWGALTLLFYGWDKLQAKRGGWRVPEIVLHGLALAGGVAGGWLGMFIFRHKTQQPEFKLVLITAAVVHAAILTSLLH